MDMNIDIRKDGDMYVYTNIYLYTDTDNNADKVLSTEPPQVRTPSTTSTTSPELE